MTSSVCHFKRTQNILNQILHLLPTNKTPKYYFFAFSCVPLMSSTIIKYLFHKMKKRKQKLFYFLFFHTLLLISYLTNFMPAIFVLAE